MNAGDVVLKSGGPVMTVVEAGSDVVKCTWFTDGVNYSCYFPVGSLNKKKFEK